MKEAFQRICELQKEYAADNTPAMQERGLLVRGQLKSSIEGLRPLLTSRLQGFGDDFLVEASDGIGRKTELPWVRYCSRSMSPKPTEGFYCVTHFATAGTGVFITVGCGSSKFHYGSSVPLPDAELDAQTAWARDVIVEEFGTLAPFDDVPDFGARRRLPISFQRATAIAKRVRFDEINTTDFVVLYQLAAERLRAVYRAQSIGRDLSDADLGELAIAAALKPGRSAGYRQGYGLSAPARRAVELQAMKVAEDWLKANGYDVRDVSAVQSYDFLAIKDGKEVKVEVKGTTSDRVDAILMTRNEVALHRNERGSTALIIVGSIRLRKDSSVYVAAGGHPEVLLNWNIDDWAHEPTAFRLGRPAGALL